MSDTREVEVLVLGAGMAGLGAGVQAGRLGRDSLILEAAAESGGLCRSTTLHGCRFDLGPKILLLDGSPVRDELLGFAGRADWLPMRQQAYLDGVGLVGFPVQRHLADLPAPIRDRALADLRTAWAGDSRPRNYREWLSANFGDYLCEEVLFPYEEKKWRVDLSGMAHEWALGRPTAVARREILAGAEGPVPSAGGYYYPARGSMATLVAAIAAEAGPVRHDSPVTEVDPARQTVTAGGVTYRYANLVSTLPLDVLLRVTRDGPHIGAAATALRWCGVKVVNLVFDGRAELPGTAVHFPSPRFPFRRLCVLPNLCPALDRPGLTPVSAELPPDGDEHAVLPALREIPEFAALGRLLDQQVITLPYAYPMPLVGTGAVVDEAHRWYARKNIAICGRGGTFRYLNSDLAYWQGRQAVLREPVTTRGGLR